MSLTELVVGIDVGTGGVRVIACDAAGTPWAEAEHPLTTVREGPFVEQDPRAWWAATASGLRQVTAAVQGRGLIRAVGVTATSGTVCLLAADGQPVRPALLYSDSRAGAEAAEVNALAQDLCDRLGYRFHSSWALPKLLWLLRHEPAHLAAARYFAHAGDFVTGCLCGDFAVTDPTQALKTGYDLLREQWPTDLLDQLGLPPERLPRVVRSGAAVGTVTPAAAAETGLAPGTVIVAGMTDGCAAQVAAGATRPGQWFSVIGTTLVIKGVTTELLRDPAGRVYCHRHPSGDWLPGAASNTGGEALAPWPRAQLPALDQEAAQRTPTSLLTYPLRSQGERFPFVHPEAVGFTLGTPSAPGEAYTAVLEGVAYVERLGFAVLRELGAVVAGPILTAGGGAKSAVWNQIRADVLQLPLSVPRLTGASFGAAVLAATAAFDQTLVEAAARMTHAAATVLPRPAYAAAYTERYAGFVEACRARGYLRGASSG